MEHSLANRCAWLLDQQNLDGGFGFWPDNASDTFSTAVVLRALITAQAWFAEKKPRHWPTQRWQSRTAHGASFQGRPTQPLNSLVARAPGRVGAFNNPADALAAWAVSAIAPERIELASAPTEPLGPEQLATEALAILSLVASNTSDGLHVMGMLDHLEANACKAKDDRDDNGRALALMTLAALRPETPVVAQLAAHLIPNRQPENATPVDWWWR